MKEKLKKLLNDIRTAPPWQTILLVALAAVAVGGACWLLLILLQYIAENKEFFVNTLTTIGVIIGIFYYWRYDKRQKAEKEQKRKQDEQTYLAEAERQQQLARADKKYKRLCGCLFTVLTSVSENVGLVRPDRPERLHSPGKILDAGNFLQYRYQCLKRSKEIDEQAIMHILQEEIDNRMNANEWGFKTTTFPYKGELYSIIQVVNMEDCGNYLHIDLAIANENVCAYILNMAYARFEDANTFAQVPEDDDF